MTGNKPKNPLNLRGAVATLPPEQVEDHLDAIFECTAFLGNNVDALLLMRDAMENTSFATSEQRRLRGAMVGTIDALRSKFLELRELVVR
jgi:hypothetical protein